MRRLEYRLADAGGWKDVSTLPTCYRQADEETLLAVTSAPRKRRELRRGDLKELCEVLPQDVSGEPATGVPNSSSRRKARRAG